MLRNLKDLEGFSLHATDGNIGEIKEFYFDDRHWAVRYLVVETGTWMASKKILLSPISIKHIDWENRELSVGVSREQVKNSPSIDTHKPVSRQNEIDYLAYYGYPQYWGGSTLWGSFSAPYMMTPGYHPNPDMPFVADPDTQITNETASFDHHLRSSSEVINYRIEAIDDEVGHLEGLLIDPDTWAIRYLILNTSNWWLGHLALINPHLINKVSWPESKLFVEVTRDKIKTAPHYDATMTLDLNAQNAVDQHYGGRVFAVDN